MARQNLLATYSGLAETVEGVKRVESEGFDFYSGPVEFAFCNYAAGFDLESGLVEPVVARLKSHALSRPVFFVFGMGGDRPEDFADRLVRAGFECRQNLVQMSAPGVDEGEPGLLRATDVRQRALVAEFMAANFFGRAGEDVRRRISRATQTSPHDLWWIEEDGIPVGAVMTVATDGVIGLYNLCVAESHRRRQLGAGLVKAVRQMAGGGRHVVLQCDHLLAMWYERLGFEDLSWVSAYALRVDSGRDII